MRSKGCIVSKEEDAEGTRYTSRATTSGKEADQKHLHADRVCNYKVKSHATQAPKFPTTPVQMQGISQTLSQRLPKATRTTNPKRSDISSLQCHPNPLPVLPIRASVQCSAMQCDAIHPPPQSPEHTALHASHAPHRPMQINH